MNDSTPTLTPFQIELPRAMTATDLLQGARAAQKMVSHRVDPRLFAFEPLAAGRHDFVMVCFGQPVEDDSSKPDLVRLSSTLTASQLEMAGMSGLSLVAAKRPDLQLEAPIVIRAFWTDPGGNVKHPILDKDSLGTYFNLERVAETFSWPAGYRFLAQRAR